MYKRILLPTDGSSLAQHAIDHGVKLAAATGASVVGVLVSAPFASPYGFDYVPTPLLPVDIYEKAAKANAEKQLAYVRAAAEKAGVAFKPVHGRSLDAATGILEVCSSNKCDLIVIGSHGRGGLASALLGSVATKILARSSVPVLVHRDPRKAARPIARSR